MRRADAIDKNRRMSSRASRWLPVLALLVASWSAVSSGAMPPSLPHVHLVATGGTISNKDGGRLTAEDLARSMPGLEKVATLTQEQFANVASGQITLTQWLQLSRRVNQLFDDDRDLAGVVVTSGTDTLEETAFFLHLTVKDARPVVVVGSMRNPSTLGYEGAANLLEGVRVAAEPTSRGKGALVVLNDEINSARDVTKTDALRLQTFRSPTQGLLGIVDADRVVYFREILQRHTAKSEFDVKDIDTLPRVDLHLAYQGAEGDLIRASVDNGAKGIVVAGVGAGGVSGTQGDALDYAASKGVLIVTGTRTGAGRIIAPRTPPPNPTEAQLRRRSLTVFAEDHMPVKARILLMLALTKTAKRDEIQRIFSEY